MFTTSFQEQTGEIRGFLKESDGEKLRLSHLTTVWILAVPEKGASRFFMGLSKGKQPG